MNVTSNSRIPFGPYKKMKMKDCPDRGLTWMVEHLVESDLCQFAQVAKQLLKERGENSVEDLEKQADDFLREHGIDPKTLEEEKD